MFWKAGIYFAWIYYCYYYYLNAWHSLLYFIHATLWRKKKHNPGSSAIQPTLLGCWLTHLHTHTHTPTQTNTLTRFKKFPPWLPGSTSVNDCSSLYLFVELWQLYWRKNTMSNMLVAGSKHIGLFFIRSNACKLTTSLFL